MRGEEQEYANRIDNGSYYSFSAPCERHLIRVDTQQLRGILTDAYLAAVPSPSSSLAVAVVVQVGIVTLLQI